IAGGLATGTASEHECCCCPEGDRTCEVLLSHGVSLSLFGSVCLLVSQWSTWVRATWWRRGPPLLLLSPRCAPGPVCGPACSAVKTGGPPGCRVPPTPGRGT